MRCCQEAGVCQEACVLGAASQSRRGAVSMADLCSRHSAQAETPTHVKCHSTNLFPMQPRYNRRDQRQTHLISPQNEIPRRLSNSQIYRLYLNEIHSFLSLLLWVQLYAHFRHFGQLVTIFQFLHRHMDCMPVLNCSIWNQWNLRRVTCITVEIIFIASSLKCDTLHA